MRAAKNSVNDIRAMLSKDTITKLTTGKLANEFPIICQTVESRFFSIENPDPHVIPDSISRRSVEYCSRWSIMSVVGNAFASGYVDLLEKWIEKTGGTNIIYRGVLYPQYGLPRVLLRYSDTMEVTPSENELKSIKQSLQPTELGCDEQGNPMGETDLLVRFFNLLDKHFSFIFDEKSDLARIRGDVFTLITNVTTNVDSRVISHPFLKRTNFFTVSLSDYSIFCNELSRACRANGNPPDEMLSWLRPGPTIMNTSFALLAEAKHSFATALAPFTTPDAAPHIQLASCLCLIDLPPMGAGEQIWAKVLAQSALTELLSGTPDLSALKDRYASMCQELKYPFGLRPFTDQGFLVLAGLSPVHRARYIKLVHEVDQDPRSGVTSVDEALIGYNILHRLSEDINLDQQSRHLLYALLQPNFDMNSEMD